MKRILCLLVVLAFTSNAFAQLRQRLELAEVTSEENNVELEVFKMQDNGQYYLSVGHLGIGDDVIQLQIDPLFELFIPLGESASEALENLKKIQSYYKFAPDRYTETEGCLCMSYPDDNFEPVRVTYKKLIVSRVLEFSIRRPSGMRATFIPRSSFNSLVGSFKFYCKLHPSE